MLTKSTLKCERQRDKKDRRHVLELGCANSRVHFSKSQRYRALESVSIRTLNLFKNVPKRFTILALATAVQKSQQYNRHEGTSAESAEMPNKAICCDVLRDPGTIGDRAYKEQRDSTGRCNKTTDRCYERPGQRRDRFLMRKARATHVWCTFVGRCGRRAAFLAIITACGDREETIRFVAHLQLVSAAKPCIERSRTNRRTEPASARKSCKKTLSITRATLPSASSYISFCSAFSIFLVLGNVFGLGVLILIFVLICFKVVLHS